MKQFTSEGKVLALNDSSVIGFIQYINGKLIENEKSQFLLKELPSISEIDNLTFYEIVNELFLNKKKDIFDENRIKEIKKINPNVLLELRGYRDEDTAVYTLIFLKNQTSIDQLRVIKMEEIISEISHDFLQTNYSEIDLVINKALEKIGIFFGVDRCFIFEISDDAKLISNTYEWSDTNTKPMIDELQDIPISEYPWFSEKLLNGETIYISDVDFIPSEKERELMKMQNIKSSVLLPLFLEKRFFGFIGMDNTKSEIFWNEEIERLLFVMTEIIIRGKQKQEIEQELINSYKQTLDLIETSPIGIAIHQNFEIKYINPNGKKILQIPHDSRDKYTLDDFAIKSKINQIKKIASQTYSGQDIGWIEIKIKTHKSKKRMLRYTEIPFYYRDEPAALAFFQDITLDKAIQEELAVSEKKFRTLFNSSLDAIYISTEEGKLIDWNPAFNKIFGYTDEELTKINTKELYFETENRKIFLDSVYKTPIQENVEMVMRHKNGDPVYTLLSINAKIEKGKITQLRGIIKDITNLKLTTEALVESERLNSMGLLAGGIAHDINNMLTTISGYAGLIDEISDNEDIDDMIQKILISTNKLRDLTDKLLAYAGKKIKFTEEVDIDQEIEEIQDFLRITVSNTVVFTYDLTSNASVHLDRTQFSQVMINLVTNAVESTEDRNIKIKISTKLVELDNKTKDDYNIFDPLTYSDGKYVRISVEDNGEGMDNSTVSKIFQPFFSTKFQGRGLGLSATLGIIKNHNGAIGVKTQVGNGTTFDIFLPFDTQRVATLENIDPEYIQNKEHKRYSNVLVIDDQPDILEVADQMLDYLETKHHVTTNIQEFIEFCCDKDGNSDFDLLIIDQMMPYMNGIDVIAELREQRNYTGDIYLMSGYSKEFVDDKFKEYNIRGFLQKPLSLQKLKDLLFNQ